MQKSFPRKCGISATLVLGFALMSPDALLAVSKDQVITSSGQKISSIFEGLMPSQFMLECVRHHQDGRRRKEKLLLDERQSEGYFGAHYTPL